MNKKVINPPAFPIESLNNKNSGMSKRFYAACSAMSSLLSNQYWIESIARICLTHTEKVELTIKVSYMYANELLKQEFNTEK